MKNSKHKSKRSLKKISPTTKGIIFGSLAGVILIVLITLITAGFFTKVEIKEGPIGPYKIVYERFVGPYQNVNPTMNKIYTDLKSDDIETFKGIGLYYDNPSIVAPENLRSDVGSVIEEEDYDKLAALGDKYKVMDLPTQEAIYAEFPYKNQMSIIAGVMKVYPELTKYMASKGYDINSMEEGSYIVEVYDMPNKKIIYIFPIPEE